jgi:hypothetical protein
MRSDFMGEYKSWKNGATVEITSLKDFQFPPTGDKILLKARPPLALEMKSD